MRWGKGGWLFVLIGVGLVALGGCESSSPTSAGSVATNQGSAHVALRGGPSTADALVTDASAQAGCAGGDPSTGLDGGAACTGALAPSVFQNAICSCGSIQSTGLFTTDAFNSQNGGPTGGLGGNVGLNASASWLGSTTIGGTVVSPAGIYAPAGGLVRS